MYQPPVVLPSIVMVSVVTSVMEAGIFCEGCGYVPEVEGVPCQHEHDGECGYVPADLGQLCGYVCHICPVQALIDALPDTENTAVLGVFLVMRAQAPAVLLRRQGRRRKQSQHNTRIVYQSFLKKDRGFLQKGGAAALPCKFEKKGVSFSVE